MLRILDHASVDWPIAAAISVVAWRPLGLTNRLSRVPDDHLRATFGSSATAIAILAGFTVSTTFYFATSDARTLESFRAAHGLLLNRTLVGAFVSLIACVFAIVGAILTAPLQIAGLLFIASMCVTALKLARVAFFTYAMLTARYRDTRQAPVLVNDQDGAGA